MPAVKHLLIWTENYWIGGCDRFLVDLINGLRGAPVEIALAGNPHSEFDAWLDRQVPWLKPRTVIPVANLVQNPLHRLDRWRTPGPPGVPGPEAEQDGLSWKAGIALARYGQAAVNLQRLRRLLRRARPDVLLINNGGYPGGESCRVAAIAAREAGVSRIVQFVHNMAHPPAWPTSVEHALDRRIDLSVDRWATAAHRASAELSERRGIARDRIETVHYGVPRLASGKPGRDLSLRTQLGFDGERPGLLAVANLEPRKGLSVLLRALAQLRDGGLALPMALVGDGPLRQKLTTETAQLGLGGSVRLLGWRDDVDAIMDEASVLVLPALSNECLPYAILEAMSHRLPVVSTDVAGIPEMVLDGETGRIVSPGDADALAQALAELATRPATAREMGERGYKRVQTSFSSEAMIQAMLTLLAVG